MKTRLTTRWALAFLALFALAGSLEGPARAQSSYRGVLAFGVIGKDPGLFRVAASGSGLRVLTKKVDPAFPLDYDPDWSPNGEEILFAGDPPGDPVPGIFKISADGSNFVRLSRAPCYADYDPDWAPDGLSILYRHDTCETARAYLMMPNGTEKEKITTQPTFGPIWSPDGSHIAFYGLDENRLRQIYVMEPDGEPRQLTGTTEPTGTEPYSSDPAWHPDGQQLVYTGNQRDGNRNNPDTADVCVINIDGTGQMCLTEAEGRDYDAEFSPAGDKIVFVSTRNGEPELFLIDPDGANETQLTDNDGGDFNPTWSPDGSLIAFLSRRSGNVDLYVMKPDGSGIRRLTKSRAREIDPAWRGV